MREKKSSIIQKGKLQTIDRRLVQTGDDDATFKKRERSFFLKYIMIRIVWRRRSVTIFSAILPPFPPPPFAISSTLLQLASAHIVTSIIYVIRPITLNTITKRASRRKLNKSPNFGNSIASSTSFFLSLYLFRC